MLHEIILLSIIHESVKRIEVRGLEWRELLANVQVFHVSRKPESARLLVYKK
ncbi:hypothetical protein FX981_00759 [Bacillus safensis]|uniref:Uncharacterized protein n=1 Tax=Bacillus safensis TaxID=561879 RepID=A0A5C0WEZ1_BACIA|nr:hypothetical protein FX981_00759 [Bacillus safensis]